MHVMLTRLHLLPDLMILTIVLIVVVGLAMAAPFVGQLFRGGRAPGKGTDEAAYDAYKAITAMIGVVLAFSLVQVNGNLRTAETTVGREAVALAAVDRILLRMGSPAADARPLLAAYGRSRIDDEWPDMARGERDAKTDALYTEVSKAVRALTPSDMRQQAMFGELLKSVDDLAETREMLILDSELSLPDFFWITTLGLLILSLALAMLTAPTLARVVSLAAAATAIALLLAFVIIVDLPFEGDTSVKPGPLEKTLVLNGRRI